MQVGQLIMYYTPKKVRVLPFAFFFYLPGLQKPGRYLFSTNLADWFKIGHLWVETNKNMKDLLTEMWRRFDFKMCGVISFWVYFKSQFGNMFLVNGKLFSVNGKPFLILFHISCRFFKYAWCIFKATQVRVYKCIKTTYKFVNTYYNHIKILCHSH